MSEKIDKLLAVLDMTEDEQEEWCRDKAMPFRWRDSLADLAFRLRDEMVKNGYASYFYDGMTEVLKAYQKNDCVPSMASFLAYHAQPIHWIIAALIAKEMSK